MASIRERRKFKLIKSDSVRCKVCYQYHKQILITRMFKSKEFMTPQSNKRNGLQKGTS